MEPEKTFEHDGKLWVEKDTEDFRAKCAAAETNQEALNEGMKLGLLEAVEVEGKWYYGLEGLNQHFPIKPLGEGRGWSD